MIKVMIKQGEIEKVSANTIIVPIFKDVQNTEPDFVKLDNVLNKIMSQAIEDNPHIAEEFSMNMFFTNKRIKADRIMLVGLGESEKLTAEKIRKTGGNIASALKGKEIESIALISFGFGLKKVSIEKATKAITEGVILGAYDFDEYKTDKKEKAKKKLELLYIIPQNDFDTAKITEAVDFTQTVCETVYMVRDLINEPSNKVTPSYMAKFAKNLCGKTKIQCKVMGKEEIKKEKMDCIIGVAKGSIEEPKLIRMDYKGNSHAKHVVLVGKGVTFDSGGINLKPENYIEDMKEDMAGAATMMGIIYTAAKLKLPLNLTAIMPCVENMPSGSALKPGDIITASSGKTVEIKNTDAEGRLILSDALYYAAKLKPDAIIDAATLTGAVTVALGKTITGIMGNNDSLIKEIIKAGDECDEKIWQLPLWE